jgi:hypothetical protein
VSTHHGRHRAERLQQQSQQNSLLGQENEVPPHQGRMVMVMVREQGMCSSFQDDAIAVGYCFVAIL